MAFFPVNSLNLKEQCRNSAPLKDSDAKILHGLIFRRIYYYTYTVTLQHMNHAKLLLNS